MDWGDLALALTAFTLGLLAPVAFVVWKVFR
jgi:hypothetical protein